MTQTGTPVTGATLALAIPVWNDPHGVQRLVAQAQALGCFDQIIVVDDASEPALPALPPQVQMITHETQQGAGGARNRALADVTASHLLFFDSDDALTPEIAVLWRALRGRAFDFCQFRHADSRMMRDGHAGQMRLDEALWRQAGAIGHALATAPAASLPLLAQTANYPWNKIYRTGFLRDYDLRCSATSVHNDIALHWRSFFCARTVLTSDRVGARHYVAAGADRLTNRRGTERMVVFEVLGEVLVALPLAVHQRAAFTAAFWRFASTLFDWVRGTLAPVHHGHFDAALSQFVRTHLGPEPFALLVQHDPVMARRLVAQMDAGARAA